MSASSPPGRASRAVVDLSGPEARRVAVTPCKGPIDVLIVVDKFDYHGSYLNGPTRYYSWLVEHLDRSRFRPTLCALRSRGRSDAVFRELGIEVVYLGAARWNPLVLLDLVRLVRTREIDVLHLTGYGSTTFGRLAAALCGKPAILHEHWVDPDYGWFLAAVERALSVIPAQAIAISDYARDFLIGAKGMAPEDIVVIRNGIPLDAFWRVSARDGRRAREALGLPAHVPVVGTVGMLHENKGYHHLLAAAARLKPRWPDAVFTLVGDGVERHSLEALADELGVSDTVRFLGHRHDVPAMLAMMDIWVMSSFTETAPLSLLEAMAAGKAIVTTDCGGPGEVVEDGHTGRVVPPGDPKRLAEAIEQLLDSPEERRRLGVNARRASRRYGIKEMVRAVEELYVEAVEDGVTRSRD